LSKLGYLKGKHLYVIVKRASEVKLWARTFISNLFPKPVVYGDKYTWQ